MVAAIMAPAPSPVGSPALEPHGGALSAALAQFGAAADHLALDPGMRAILSSCQREWTVHFPIRRDDGRVEVYTGYRVQRARTSTTCVRWPCG
jgi:glutamate dehydrogenase (NAD(P)+)